MVKVTCDQVDLTQQRVDANLGMPFSYGRDDFEIASMQALRGADPSHFRDLDTIMPFLAQRHEEPLPIAMPADHQGPACPTVGGRSPRLM